MYMNNQMKRYIGLSLGESQSSGASVPEELGCLIFQVWMDVFTHLPRCFLNPVQLGFYGDFLT